MHTRWNVSTWQAALASVGFVVAAALALPSPAAAQGASEQVTFTKDIAPILQRSCQRCHRPDSVAPMSLMTYEEVRPWARAIKQRTALRDKPGVMPPWYIEKNIGIQRYKNDPSLSDAELTKIAKWADSGAPRGNPNDMPAPAKFTDEGEWQLGKPDLVVKAPTVAVKPDAPDWWGVLAPVDVELREDRYVSSVEVREVNDSKGKPGRSTVGGLYLFHHAVFMILDKDGKPVGDAVGGWPVHEVGRNPDVFDPDSGKLVTANSKLLFNSVHLHSNGKDTNAHLEVGFTFHPKGYKPKVTTTLLAVGNGPDLDIRGMDPNQKMEAYFTLPQHAKITVYEPHMHAPGVRMCLEAVWGITSETLSCSGYDHSWVRGYAYADDAAPLLPKGTILKVVGYFNNSPSNKNVVDPRNWSGAGHRSVDNMVINLMQAIFLTDAQFQEEMAKRRQELKLTEGQGVIGCPLCGQTRAPQRTAGNQ